MRAQREWGAGVEVHGALGVSDVRLRRLSAGSDTDELRTQPILFQGRYRSRETKGDLIGGLSPRPGVQGLLGATALTWMDAWEKRSPQARPRRRRHASRRSGLWDEV